MSDNKQFTSKCEDFKNELVGLINTTELPIGAIYWIMQAISKEVADIYSKTLEDETATKEEPVVEQMTLDMLTEETEMSTED